MSTETLTLEDASALRFASPWGIPEAEALNEKTRAFTGEGTPFLKTPALLKIHSIRAGSTSIPLIEERRYPINEQETNPVAEPMVKLMTRPDTGEIILVRSNLSNHGIWPKDVVVHITGDWEDAPETVTETTPAEVLSTPITRGRARNAVPDVATDPPA